MPACVRSLTLEQIALAPQRGRAGDACEEAQTNAEDPQRGPPSPLLPRAHYSRRRRPPRLIFRDSKATTQRHRARPTMEATTLGPTEVVASSAAQSESQMRPRALQLRTPHFKKMSSPHPNAFLGSLG